MVTFGSTSFHCFSYYGLRVEQWLICIAFAVVGNFISVLLKLVDENKLFKCKIFEVKEEEDEQGEKIKEGQHEETAQQQ